MRTRQAPASTRRRRGSLPRRARRRCPKLNRHTRLSMRARTHTLTRVESARPCPPAPPCMLSLIASRGMRPRHMQATAVLEPAAIAEAKKAEGNAAFAEGRRVLRRCMVMLVLHALCCAGEWAQAAVYYTEALQAVPLHHVCLANRCACFLKLGHHDKVQQPSRPPETCACRATLRNCSESAA